MLLSDKPHIASFPYVSPCGAANPPGKWIRERGKPGLKVVLGKANRVGIAKSRAWGLEIGCDVQSIVNSGTATNDGVRTQRVGKAKPGSPIVAVHRHVAMSGGRKFRGAQQIAGPVDQGHGPVLGIGVND